MQPTDSKQFHNDLRAAISARVPLEIGDGEHNRRPDRLTLGKLNALEAKSLARNTSLESADLGASDQVKLHSGLPPRYQAALRVFDQTGTMLPVLDGLSKKRVAEQEVTRILSWSFVYLLLILVLAITGLSLFSIYVVPTLNSLRVDLQLPAAIRPGNHFYITRWLPITVSVLAGMLILFLVWLPLGGSRTIAMWLGGRHYVRSQSAAAALRILQALVVTGSNIDEAVPLSSALAGTPESTRQEIRSAVQSLEAVPDTDQSGNKEYIQQLNELERYLEVSANQRLANLRVTMPIMLVSVVGGSITLLYCLSVFWPLVALVRDLPTAGV